MPKPSDKSWKKAQAIKVKAGYVRGFHLTQDPKQGWTFKSRDGYEYAVTMKEIEHLVNRGSIPVYPTKSAALKKK